MLKGFTVRVLTAAIAFLSLIASVHAADVRPFISASGDYRAIVIEGVVEPGDYDRFVGIVRENQGRVSGVFLFSPGGDFAEAMKIGRAMRALELSSQVPMRSSSGRPICEEFLHGLKPKDATNCNAASAAFFIHIGAVDRGGTYLAVHRPTFASSRFGNLSQAEAKAAFQSLQEMARGYMQEMGVPAHIQEEVLGTPSDRALVLDDKTIKTYFSGSPAYRQEWVRNRCSRMSDAERARSEGFTRRFLLPRNHPDASFSESEMEEVGKLRSKRDDESKCAIDIGRLSRLEAYEKFFGAKPTDVAGHNFSRWSQAEKYLGRQFYEVASEERFEEDRLGDNHFLKRAATATGPSVTLGDFGSTKQRVVTWINLVSTPSPSREFVSSLVESLRREWGEPSGGNQTDLWTWQRSKYLARLRHEPVSATGPFISLVIEAK